MLPSLHSIVLHVPGEKWEILSKKLHSYYVTLSEKKGTKAVTVAVPFQKVDFCTKRVHIGTLMYKLASKMYRIALKIYIIAPKM